MNSTVPSLIMNKKQFHNDINYSPSPLNLYLRQISSQSYRVLPLDEKEDETVPTSQARPGARRASRRRSRHRCGTRRRRLARRTAAAAGPAAPPPGPRGPAPAPAAASRARKPPQRPGPPTRARCSTVCLGAGESLRGGGGAGSRRRRGGGRRRERRPRQRPVWPPVATGGSALAEAWSGIVTGVALTKRDADG